MTKRTVPNMGKIELLIFGSDFLNVRNLVKILSLQYDHFTML